MHINTNYKLRNVLGENVIVRQGAMEVDLTTIISLNPSAKFLYEELLDKEFTAEDVVKTLENHYEVEPSIAEQDAKKWIDSLKEAKVIGE